MQVVNQPMVLQGTPTVIHQAPSSMRNAVAVTEVKTMGILQVVIGSLSVLLGIPAIVLLDYYAAFVAYPIWGGIWIIATGALGISSAKNPTNGCLNGTHMAFNIVSCIVSFIDFIVYAVAVAVLKGGRLEYRCTPNYPYSCYYTHVRNWEAGVAIYAILLVLMISEFVIALTASIYCCKAGCDCCSQSIPGVIVQGPQPMMGQVSYMHTTTLPPGSQPTAYTQPMATGYYTHAVYPQQPYMTTATGSIGAPAQTQVSYTNAGMEKMSQGQYQSPVEPPPAYN